MRAKAEWRGAKGGETHTTDGCEETWQDGSDMTCRCEKKMRWEIGKGKLLLWRQMSKHSEMYLKAAHVAALTERTVWVMRGDGVREVA